MGQLISVKHGRYPSRGNKKLRVARLEGNGKTMLGLLNVRLNEEVHRWVRAFHAALYREPLLGEAAFVVETPFPRATFTSSSVEFVPLRRQHQVFVAAIKEARAGGRIDYVSSNNGRLRYECTWCEATTGRWACIFAVDLYGWKKLGDIHNFSARGCAGSYLADKRPPSATAMPLLAIAATNQDGLDPFGY